MYIYLQVQIKLFLPDLIVIVYVIIVRSHDLYKGHMTQNLYSDMCHMAVFDIYKHLDII